MIKILPVFAPPLWRCDVCGRENAKGWSMTFGQAHIAFNVCVDCWEMAVDLAKKPEGEA